MRVPLHIQLKILNAMEESLENEFRGRGDIHDQNGLLKNLKNIKAAKKRIEQKKMGGDNA